MKRTITFFALAIILVPFYNSLIGQLNPTTETGKFTRKIKVNNREREYIIYIPSSYTGSNSVPLLLSFHGLTSTMDFNYKYTKFNELAEKENFIVAWPNGLSKKWSMRGNNTTDLDFIDALLNLLEKEYNINTKRIYCTGMSMGGFFSYHLACNFSARIAAIASVTGSMYRFAMMRCKPSRPIPVMQIHGTSDPIVRYSTISSLMDYWTKHNKTDKTPTVTAIPDTDPNDGSTVERFVYSNGKNGSEVQHLKIKGGTHKWPGHKGNMDISATDEVWNFLKRFDLDGKI